MRTIFAWAFVLSMGVHATGQAQDHEGVATEPMRCWWRTSAAAVRVGEVFSVVLTCSVVQTEAFTVVPSQAELEPSAMQLTPFEVTGGAHGTDLQVEDHRFFQYEYRVRLVGEEVFGKDIKLPELKITYKVRSRTDGDALEGRDQTYVLPPISVRVISLVPADASDIRDASLGTFEDIDRRLSRANVLRVVGGVLIGFAALAALVAMVRAVRSRGDSRGRTAPSLVSDTRILRDVGRELADIQRTRRGGEWTPGLAARLLTALRIISAYALGVPTTPLAAVPGAPGASDLNGFEGHLNVRGRGLRGRKVILPAWVTPNVITQELERPPAGNPTPPQRARVLEQLRAVLSRMTAAQYGRDNQLDDQVLDDALDAGVGVLRRLKIENAWVVKKVRSFRPSKADVADRAWSR
ncbi:MAG TPA: hypothetical protein VGJ39_16230 [Vicinamibacterales bacterium]